MLTKLVIEENEFEPITVTLTFETKVEVESFIDAVEEVNDEEIELDGVNEIRTILKELLKK